MRIAGGIVGILLLCLVPRAHAVSPSCTAMPNLACAGADDTLTGTYTIVDVNPLIFDGATGGGSATTWSVVDPTGARTITVPDANTALPQAINCGAGTHVDEFNVTTGAFTCTADTGGTPTWDAIADPTAAQTLSMTSFTTDFVWGAATGAGVDLMEFRDSTSNTGTGYVVAISTASGSAAQPVAITAGGLVNGVEMTTAGKLQNIGTGSIEADALVCGSVCVGTAEIVDNAVDGTKLGIGTAQGDVLVYGGTDWAALALGADNTVLQSNGTTAVWAGIDAAMLGAGDLANVLVWQESAGGTWPAKTVTNAPRNKDTFLVVVDGLTYQRKTTLCASEVNEYNYCVNADCTGLDAPCDCCTGAGAGTCSATTITMCNSTDEGEVRVTYEM